MCVDEPRLGLKMMAFLELGLIEDETQRRQERKMRQGLTRESRRWKKSILWQIMLPHREAVCSLGGLKSLKVTFSSFVQPLAIMAQQDDTARKTDLTLLARRKYKWM